ncbi:hypothetical protein TWF718_010491 [Orbilia javanica]|uniref:Uncharacterized protein n=1 Tax=Orbilia javanica TaxID=47235 RepID=A0AAN8NPR3_9PEZI
MSAMYQLMSLPRLEELAIPFPDPSFSPVNLDEKAFPSLRVLWILSALDLIIPRSLQNNRRSSNLLPLTLPDIAIKRKGYLEKIFGKSSYYPNKLEIIGMGLKSNDEDPEDILLISKTLPPGYISRPETEIQDFNRVRKAVTALLPDSLSDEEYSWVKIFEIAKRIWHYRD